MLKVTLVKSLSGRLKKHIATAMVHGVDQLIYLFSIPQKHHNIASFLRSSAPALRSVRK